MKNNILYLIILLIISIIFFFIIGLGGEYPLGDDWSFNFALKHLIENGELYLTDWTSMPLLTQLFTGYIFSFGEFSFVNARISTLFLSFFSVILVYFISKESGSTSKMSFINSLFLITNPLFIHFSFSFNTDTNYIFWFLLYLYFILKYYKNNSKYVLFISMIIFIFSILLRDLTFIVPIALIINEIYQYYKNKTINKRNIIISLLFIFIFITTSYLYNYYLEINNNIPELFYLQKTMLFENLSSPINLLLNMFKSLFKMIIYLSVYFFVPYFIFNVNSNIFKNKQHIILSITFSLVIIFINTFFYEAKLFNFIFSDFILFYEFVGSYNQMQIFTNIILFISINSLILSLLNFNFKKEILKNNKFIILLISILYLLLFSLISPFARYLIILVPLLAIFFNIKLSKINIILISIYFLFLSSFMTIPLALDNHQLVSKLWSQANKLEMKGISKDSIVAGFEYSGWHHYEKGHKNLKINYFIENPKYLIATFKHENYYILDSIELKTLNILKKETYIYTQIRKQ